MSWDELWRRIRRDGQIPLSAVAYLPVADCVNGEMVVHVPYGYAAGDGRLSLPRLWCTYLCEDGQKVAQRECAASPEIAGECFPPFAQDRLEACLDAYDGLMLEAEQRRLLDDEALRLPDAETMRRYHDEVLALLPERMKALYRAMMGERQP